MLIPKKEVNIENKDVIVPNLQKTGQKKDGTISSFFKAIANDWRDKNSQIEILGLF